MWLITPRGFYSAAAKPDDGDEFVTVRARSEQDMRNLAELIDAQPTRSEHADYRWHVRCRKSDWADAVRHMALEIDYVSFENRIERDDPQRARVLSQVWRDLLAIQDPKAERVAELVARIRYLLWREDEISEQLGDEEVHSAPSDRQDLDEAERARRDALRGEWQDLEKRINRLANQMPEEEQEGASVRDG